MLHPLFTYGYRKGTLRDLKAFVSNGALVIDIRFQPHVNNRTFTREHLEEVLGDGYRHLHDLGNRNYHGGPIQLVNEARGLWFLKCELERRPCVLLCACQEPSECHRHYVAQRLIAQFPEIEGQCWHLHPGFDLHGQPTKPATDPEPLPAQPPLPLE